MVLGRGSWVVILDFLHLRVLFDRNAFCLLPTSRPALAPSIVVDTGSYSSSVRTSALVERTRILGKEPDPATGREPVLRLVVSGWASDFFFSSINADRICVSR